MILIDRMRSGGWAFRKQGLFHHLKLSKLSPFHDFQATRAGNIVSEVNQKLAGGAR